EPTRELFRKLRFCVCHCQNNGTGVAHEWLDLSDRLDRRDHGCPFAPRPALAATGADHDRHLSRAGLRRAPPCARRTRRDPGGAFPLLPRMGSILGGAIAAAALALVLQAFALAIGL